MTNHNNNLLAQDCEEWFSLSLYEVTCSIGVDEGIIIEIINEGIVSVQQDEQNNWQFDSHALKRIRTVLRLQHDLGVNLPGAGLALELLDEIDNLKKQLSIRNKL
jgi:chaperone modulatory protein CbpM